MDEPRRSAAVASRYLIPIALGVLLIAWVWPEQDSSGPGPLTVYYSRLLGIRFEGQGYEPRQVAASIVASLPWVAVAIAGLRRTTERGRLLVFGAAALFGLGEILVLVTSLFRDGFFGVGTVLSGVGGVLLIAGAIVGMGHREIREPDGGAA